MIGEHFWKIVFVIGLLVGGYFWYDNWQKQNASENRMIALLDLVGENQALPDTATIEEAGVPLLKLLVKLHHYEKYENVKDARDLLDTVFERAVAEQRIDSTEVDAFRTAIIVNRKLCVEEYGVFDDPEGILMMENGRSPKVAKGAFKGDKLLVGHFVSPILAPEAKNAFANLVLTPESVFALQTDDPDSTVVRAAGRLKQIRDIGPNTLQRITRADRNQRAYKVGE